MNAHTKELTQWLRDFAAANFHNFEPEQIARLVHAADAITTLDEAVDSLIVERDDAYKRIDGLKEGFEGCCTACEPVGVLNRKLLAENAMLRIYAKNFQSRAMEELARLDEELGLIEPPNKDFLQDLG